MFIISILLQSAFMILHMNLSFLKTHLFKKFEGKPLLARHRMVNEILKEELQEIHAFTQKTMIPEQWAAKQS